MRVLLTGASGFIGRHLAAALEQSGHAVVRAGRHGDVRVDYTRDTQVSDWMTHLGEIDAVINAVGILRERGEQSFALLHVKGPCALFDACVVAGVSRVINISALGADAGARSAYHVSKRQADQHLASLPLAWTIVQPSLVYGADGESARLFTLLASLPCIPLPRGGTQRVQPVHIDDMTAGIVLLLRSNALVRTIVPFVGPRALPLRAFFEQLRASMRLGRARFIAIPDGLARIGATVAGWLPHSLFDAQTYGMLNRENVADPIAIRALLGREPRDAAQFIPSSDAHLVRASARLGWLLPVLRWSIAAVWIVTGIVSFGLYPVSESYALLARVGASASAAPILLYGAAALDIALGIATLLMRRRAVLWLAQAALILGYTIIITVRMPEFWLHPYGPLLKNLPMLAAIALLYVLEKR